MQPCPSRGNGSLQECTPKFCPYCGKSIVGLVPDSPKRKPGSAKTEETAKSASEDPAKSYADIVRQYDQFVADMQQQGMPEAEIRQRATELFATLKAQLPARDTMPSKQKTGRFKLRDDAASEGHYSVILKSCSNAERLAKRLNEIFRRGLTATRMAIQMVPCIIMYKSKTSDIQAAINIFADEQLHYTVIKGDFDADPLMEKIIPGFTDLAEEVRCLFCDVPVALWLGEKILIVVSEVDVEGELGVLVATNLSLYFLCNPVSGQTMYWNIMPYSHIVEAIRHDEQNALELVFKQFGKEELLRFSDPGELDELYEKIQPMIEK